MPSVIVVDNTHPTDHLWIMLFKSIKEQTVAGISIRKF